MRGKGEFQLLISLSRVSNWENPSVALLRDPGFEIKEFMWRQIWGLSYISNFPFWLVFNLDSKDTNELSVDFSIFSPVSIDSFLFS